MLLLLELDVKDECIGGDGANDVGANLPPASPLACVHQPKVGPAFLWQVLVHASGELQGRGRSSVKVHVGKSADEAERDALLLHAQLLIFGEMAFSSSSSIHDALPDYLLLSKPPLTNI